MQFHPPVNQNALRFALVALGGTLVALLCIRLIALHGYDAVSPIFFRLLVWQDDPAAVVMAAMILVAWLSAGSTRWSGVIEVCAHRAHFVAMFTMIALCLGALLIYRNTRLSMDEYLVYFQSQVFASGELSGHFPPELKKWLLPIGFLNMSEQSGDVVSPYLPGFALLLTPFTWLGIPWACNPVLTGCTVLVIHRLARVLYDHPLASGLSVLLTIASPVVLANGISYYSMTACMLAHAVFALLLFSEHTPRRLFIAGLVGSIALTLHSPARHIPFALPLLIWLLMRPNGVRNTALLCAGYLPLTLVLGIGWMNLNSDLAAANAPMPAGQAALALPTIELFVARVGAIAKIWVWAVPGLVALAIMGTWRRRYDTRVLVLCACALCQLVGYFLVTFDQGHGWGYRYFHSAWFTLPLLAAALAAPRDRPGSWMHSPNVDWTLLNLVAALAVFSLLAGTTLRAVQMRSFIDDHLAQQPFVAPGTKAVVFIDTSACFYCVDLIQNDSTLSEDVIRLHSQGSRANAALVQEYWPLYKPLPVDRHGQTFELAAVTREARPAP